MNNYDMQRKALFKQMLHDVVVSAMNEMCMYEPYSPELIDKLNAYFLDKLSMFLESGEMQSVSVSLIPAHASAGYIESWTLNAFADTMWGVIDA